MDIYRNVMNMSSVIYIYPHLPPPFTLIRLYYVMSGQGRSSHVMYDLRTPRPLGGTWGHRRVTE